jgi:hypothetical protein
VDFGKHHDHSVVAVADLDMTSKIASLIHLHQFPLETDYRTVIGYIKGLTERWNKVTRIMTDATGVGDVVTSDMKKAGLENIWPITFNVQTKTDILENLHRMLAKNQLKLVYDNELISEMNCEKFELNKTGQLIFSHPPSTHDDRLWAVALACHGARFAASLTEYHPVAAIGRNPNYIGPSFDLRRLRPGASTYSPRPGDPAGVVVRGQLWCWFCRRPVLTRQHTCEKPPD